MCYLKENLNIYLILALYISKVALSILLWQSKRLRHSFMICSIVTGWEACRVYSWVMESVVQWWADLVTRSALLLQVDRAVQPMMLWYTQVSLRRWRTVRFSGHSLCQWPWRVWRRSTPSHSLEVSTAMEGNSSEDSSPLLLKTILSSISASLWNYFGYSAICELTIESKWFFFLLIKLLDNYRYCSENVKLDLSRSNSSRKATLVPS